jgi:hypothetical protein
MRNWEDELEQTEEDVVGEHGIEHCGEVDAEADNESNGIMTGRDARS